MFIRPSFNALFVKLNLTWNKISLFILAAVVNKFVKIVVVKVFMIRQLLKIVHNAIMN